MTHVSQKNNEVYDPSKLEAYLRLNPTAKNDLLYSLCGASTDSEKGYIRKKKSRLLESIEVSESSLNGIDSKKDKVYTKKVKKDIFHDILDEAILKRSYSHFYDLLSSYYSLPLFIFSKIYNEALKKYGKHPRDAYIEWSCSFYDVFMNVVSKVCNSDYDDEILEYFINVEQEFGNTICQQLMDQEFSKDMEDYEEERAYINEQIGCCIDVVNEWTKDINNPSYIDFKRLLGQIVFYLFFDLNSMNAFVQREASVMKEDIKKIVLYFNRYNQEKLNFLDCVKMVNDNFVSPHSDEMFVEIERFFYIDLGMHGEEYLGYDDVYYMEGDEWKKRQVYFDTVKFV